jgi:Flp pilus assembly protein TadD
MGLVWLAWTYWSDARFHWTESPDDALARADELARCAAVIDDRFAECHALLGAIYLMKKSFDEAVDHGTRAVELEPNGADATATLAMTLAPRRQSSSSRTRCDSRARSERRPVP